MNKKAIIIIGLTTMALASIGYYFYEKVRVEKLNRNVDSVESAKDKLSGI